MGPWRTSIGRISHLLKPLRASLKCLFHGPPLLCLLQSPLWRLPTLSSLPRLTKAELVPCPLHWISVWVKSLSPDEAGGLCELLENRDQFVFPSDLQRPSCARHLGDHRKCVRNGLLYSIHPILNGRIHPTRGKWALHKGNSHPAARGAGSEEPR